MKKLFSLLTLALLTMSAWAGTDVTINFSEQGYTNAASLDGATLTKDGVTLTYAKNNGSNPPAYYTSGTNLRFYANNTLKVEATETISSIVFTYTLGDAKYIVWPTADNGTIDANGNWFGSSTSITFTNNVSGKQVRLVSMTVTLGEDTPVTPKVDAPVFNPNGGMLTQESTAVTVSCATENSSIQLYQVVDGEFEYVSDFFPSNGVTEGTFYVTETSTYAAYAYKNGMDNSDTTYVTFTKPDAYDYAYDFDVTADTLPGYNTEGATSGAYTITKDRVTFKVSNGRISNYTQNSTTYHEYRIFKDANIKFSTTHGKIVKIEIIGSEVSTDYSPEIAFGTNQGLTYEGINATWIGNAAEVTFTASGKQCRAREIIVYVAGDEPNQPEIVVADPVFNPGTTGFTGSQVVSISCETAGAQIYYDINDGGYQLYTAPFTVTEDSTVVKAYAELEGVQSAVVTAKYYKRAEVSTLAEANALQDYKDFVFYGNVVVVYQNGGYLYVKDNTAYGLIYGHEVGEFQEGATLDEEWTAQYHLFRKHINEYQYPADLVATDAELVEIVPTEYTEAAIDTTKINERVLVKGLTLTAGNDPKYLYTADGMAIYNQFGIEYPTELEGKTFDVEGMVSYYNNAVQIMPIAITEAQAAGLVGDVNNDNVVNITDVTVLISAVMTENFANINTTNADLNGDTNINITDVTMLINKVMAQ
jgi:hypothetical protein